MTEKNWRIKTSSKDAVESIIRNTGVSKVTATILSNLGLTEIKDVKNFLTPSLDVIHSPFLFKNMDEAIDRVEKALINNEVICCYGDYDVDGITGSSLLFNFFQFISGNSFPYVPNRIEEGYGLNKDAMQEIKNRGATLLISADCGIRSNDEIAYAKSIGLDIIVTDHHEPDVTLPPAVAIINPKLPDCPYPFKGISGSGVAMKFAWGIAERLQKKNRNSISINEFLIDSVAFATLGTVADMVPLLDENRTIVKYGLDTIRQAKNPGIQALIDVSLDPEKDITTEDIAFQLAPRINAAGRLGRSDLAMKLFTTTSKQEAILIANEINELNKSRREMEKSQSEEAFIQAEKMAQDYTYTMVLNASHWHTGLIGIIASRIIEKYHRPTFVISNTGNQNIARGSARSIEGFSLPDALEASKNLLIQFGGHAMAAGFELKEENIQLFRDAVENTAINKLNKSSLIPTIKIDLELSIRAITDDLIFDVQRLEPFGMANPNPIFATRNAKVIGSPRIIGKTKNHLKFKIAHQGNVASVIGFNFANRYKELIEYESIDICFYPKINEWNGLKNIDLHLKDFRKSR